MKRNYRINCVFYIVLFAFVSGCASVQTKETIFKEAQEIKARQVDLPKPTVEKAQEKIQPIKVKDIASPKPPTPAPRVDKVEVPRPVVDKLTPFHNEILTYRAKYLGISIGEMQSMVKQRKIYKGRPVIVFEATARSIPPFSKVFKVENSFVSYMDVEKFRVLYHKESRKEGRYRKESVVEFDYDKKKAYFYNDVDKTRKEVDIPDKVHDILTANYFIRMTSLDIGNTMEFKIYASEKVYDFLAVVRSHKNIKLKNFGTRTSYYVQPYAYLGGKKFKRGKIKAFFDLSDTHIPLKGLVTSPIFGSAGFLLQKVERSK